MQLKKILVPVDGWDYSMQAASYAAELARLTDAEITLINCHKPLSVVLGELFLKRNQQNNDKI